MTSVDTSSVYDNQISEPITTSTASSDVSKSKQGSFKAALVPKGNKTIYPTVFKDIDFQNTFTNTRSDHSRPMIYINIDQRRTDSDTDTPKENEEREEEEEDVSPEFINDFNKHIGNNKNKEKAHRLIEKMRRIGGLIPSFSNEDVDIPAARLGLSYLASLSNPELKIEALDNLLLLLQNDSLGKETSFNLVNLAISLMKRMNRELMQTEILDVQIKITQVYSLVAELLQRHYAKRHINAITKELKIELINTTKALQALNSQEDVTLNFYTKLALEGVRRIVDDRKELFDLLERFAHAFMAVYCLKSDQGDTSEGYRQLMLTFKDLDPHLKNAWYNGALILNELAKEAKTDINKLTAIQVLIREKWKVFNWKFTYAAIGILADLSLNGETEQIRKMAFQGIKVLGPDYPGLATFADEKDLKKYLDFSPMTHFKKPRRKNPNNVIRQFCIEHLAKIAIESNDEAIRKKARFTLVKRLYVEKKEEILAYLKTIVPETKEAQKQWIKES